MGTPLFSIPRNISNIHRKLKSHTSLTIYRIISRREVLSELQGKELPVDYSHLQLNKSDFSVWQHYFWVSSSVSFPLLSLVKPLQSSCSCSPQLALLLFPLQAFFPNLNIPRHLLNRWQSCARPSEILVNWEAYQEGLCFQFSYSLSEWEPVH